MKFKNFQSACKYMEYGCDEFLGRNFYPTCRREDRIPDGKSWGKCDKDHCPYFPKVGHNLVCTDINGKVLFTAKEVIYQ